MPAGDSFLSFQRAKFKTRLPLGRFYTQGHMWLRESGQERGVSRWEVGLTRFATRMLGEPVEIDFEVEPGQRVERGQPVGWLEGFKAVSDLFAPLDGSFDGANPALDQGLDALRSSPQDKGWLFALRGTPGEDAVDAQGYAEFLEATIDRMLGTGEVVDPAEAGDADCGNEVEGER